MAITETDSVLVGIEEEYLVIKIPKSCVGDLLDLTLSNIIGATGLLLGIGDKVSGN